jgi:hypothetical protein
VQRALAGGTGGARILQRAWTLLASRDDYTARLQSGEEWQRLSLPEEGAQLGSRALPPCQLLTKITLLGKKHETARLHERRTVFKKRG